MDRKMSGGIEQNKQKYCHDHHIYGPEVHKRLNKIIKIMNGAILRKEWMSWAG